ncbi:MAG: DNA primase [Acidobacteria bacterium]|nr:DNA primase [Acidobacteriota bacterium]
MLSLTPTTNNGKISAFDVQAEAERLLDNRNHRLQQADVLNEILDALEPIDFRAVADLDATAKVSQKVEVVVTVQEVLRVARDMNCGLCRQNDFIFSYNGEFWQLVDRLELESFLGYAAERLGIDHVTASYHLFRTSLFRQFLAVSFLPKPTTPTGVCLINLRNGTFEITPTEFRLREFRREDFLTYQLPFEYSPKATFPKWERFLDEVLPDISRQLVLAEYIGYIFTNLKLEKTLLLYGTGANGKSVVFDVMTALLGNENISHYSLQSLNHEYYRACLANKLLNYASEISTRLGADIFKKLTSGEPVEARLPYGQPFLLREYARLAFNCNELPQDKEHTEAFFRRFLILPFDVTIPEEKRNPNFAKEIIKDELSGVFNWVLSGLQTLLQQEDFTRCEASRDALTKYRHESDSVAMFLADEGFKPSDKPTEVKVLYMAYKTYCLDNYFRPLGRNNFSKRLEANSIVLARRDVGMVAYVKCLPTM